jgi:uncharacterized protein
MKDLSKMKILYVHGFGSHFDPKHEKIQLLETLGKVVGVEVDYCKGFRHVYDTVKSAALNEGVDLIVGTSMGGYMSAHVGSETGIPFVALNPAVQPSITLKKWEGNFTDFTGHDHYLNEGVIHSYPDIATTGCGLVIVESGDEVIPARTTMEMLKDCFHVEMFTGGGHRFTHMAQALPMISAHMARAAGYGL